MDMGIRLPNEVESRRRLGSLLIDVINLLNVCCLFVLVVAGNGAVDGDGEGNGECDGTEVVVDDVVVLPIIKI